MTARLQDPARLLVTLNLVRKEHCSELAGHNIKALIRKRERQSVGLLPFNSRFVRLPSHCMIQHRLIEISCDYVRGGGKPSGNRSGQNSGSCGRLQHVYWGRFGKSLREIERIRLKDKRN